MNDVSLNNVEEFNLLGLTITPSLKWRSHVDTVAGKASKVVGILRALKFILPPEALKTICDSLLVPHLNYCILASGYQWERLLKLQKKAVRLITRSPYNAHTDPLFKHLHKLKLPFYFRNMRLSRGRSSCSQYKRQANAAHQSTLS